VHKRKVFTENAPRPLGPYSQAIVAGDTVYVAGQGGFDPASGKLMNASFEEEATRTFENVKAILEAAGATTNDVVKVNVYLADLNNFRAMNEIYKSYFGEDYPARATVGSALLAGTQIEVDCIAVIGEHE
jgi:2-iminobutanoate/2-iminopropanoate deaminase